MDRTQRKKWKNKKRWRENGNEYHQNQTYFGNGSSNDFQPSFVPNTSGIPVTGVIHRANRPTSGPAQLSTNGTCLLQTPETTQGASTSWKRFRNDGSWTQTCGGQQRNTNHWERWRDSSQGRGSHHRPPGFSQWQGERQATQSWAGNGKKRQEWGAARSDSTVSRQVPQGAGYSQDGGGGYYGCQGDVPGDSGMRKKRKKQRGGNGGYDSYCSEATSGAASSTASTSSSLDIPGFYYDAEKKCYFKIQSDNYVPKDDKNVVTHSSLRKKQEETQRQKDVAAFEAGSKQTSTLSSSSLGEKIRKRQSCSFSSMLLHGYQQGEVDRRSLERAWIVGSVPQFQQTGICPVSQVISHDFHVEHSLQMEMGDNHDQLLCLWSLSGTTVERVKLINVAPSDTIHSRKLSVEFSPASDVGDFQSWNKITSLCWCDFPHKPDKKFVLYTSVCHTGLVSSLSLAFIRCVEEESPAETECLSYNLGKRAAWTSAWNRHKCRFGVGTEKGCYVIDARTRVKWHYNTMKSDVLAQVFSKEEGGNLMYTGVRRGDILMHDLRSSQSSTMPTCQGDMRHQSSVCCVRLSPDERCLYASDFQGGIKKWDLRMRREVMTYEGLFNLQSKLPFHIDETQTLLYAAGQNCYTKIWCLKTGKLLLTIPPPYEASLYSIPVLRFSTRWGGSPGNMGLVMGAHKSFYLYSLQGGEESLL